MKVRRGFVHVQHHVEHMEMGIPLLKALCVLNQSLRCPLAALRTAAAVIQIADLEDGLMEQLLLLALPDMLVVVWDLIPCLFLPGVVCLQCLVEDLMVICSSAYFLLTTIIISLFLYLSRISFTGTIRETAA